jgi:polysaccharide pyruvyl transferase WcaK-like protein
MKRKVFFVGDNRGSENWGRGASIALRQLLSGTFEISGSVAGEAFDLSKTDVGYVGTLMPHRYHRHFRYLLERRARKSIGWYIKLEELCGARDFIAEDPSVSVDNLLSNKHHNPELARIFDQAAQADLIVIDGDGDIIFATPPRRSALFFLAMMELGIRLNKPVFLVNSMISDCPKTGRNLKTMSAYRRLLGKCNAVILRDPESLEYVATQMPETNRSLIPDSLFSWFRNYQPSEPRLPRNGDFTLPFPEEDDYWGKLDFSKPYICIGGGASAGGSPDRAVQCYSQLVDAVQKLGYRVYLTENDLSDSFLQRVAAKKRVGVVSSTTSILMCGAIVANARLFISGRYHASILASLGGTPCIFLGTHSHKNGSLSRLLEYDVHRQFSAFPDDSEIGEIVSMARDYIQQGESLRSRISNVSSLRCAEAATLPALLEKHLNG